MKLRFYSLLQAVADFIERDVARTHRHAQAFRCWVWLKATRENLKTCNERQAARTRFC